MSITTEFAKRLTEIGIRALGSIPATQVADSMMMAALNVAVGCMPRKAIAEWLHRLASEIETNDPANESGATITH